MPDELYPWALIPELRPVFRPRERLSCEAKLGLARAALEFAYGAIRDGLPGPMTKGGRRRRLTPLARNEVVVRVIGQALGRLEGSD